MLTENGGSLLILSSGKEEQISSDLLKKSLQILLWEGSRRWEFEGPMKSITKCHYYSFLGSSLLFENVKCTRNAYNTPASLGVSSCCCVWTSETQLLWVAFVGSTLHVEQRETVSPRTVFMCDSYTWIRTLREKLNKEKQLSLRASWFTQIKFVTVKTDRAGSLNDRAPPTLACIEAYEIATGIYGRFSLNASSNWSPVTAESSWNLIKGQETPKSNFVLELLCGLSLRPSTAVEWRFWRRCWWLPGEATPSHDMAGWLISRSAKSICVDPVLHW